MGINIFMWTTICKQKHFYITEFEIWFNGAPPAALDSGSTPFYNVSITCDDGAVYSITEVYNVEIADAVSFSLFNI